MDKFRYNAKRASLVQSRIKAIERLGETEVVEDDPEYIFKYEDCRLLSVQPLPAKSLRCQ